MAMLVDRQGSLRQSQLSFQGHRQVVCRGLGLFTGLLSRWTGSLVKIVPKHLDGPLHH